MSSPPHDRWTITTLSGTQFFVVECADGAWLVATRVGGNRQVAPDDSGLDWAKYLRPAPWPPRLFAPLILVASPTSAGAASDRPTPRITSPVVCVEQPADRETNRGD